MSNTNPNPPGSAAVEDPFRLGWRHVREVGPDGQETVRQVPLTERDLLFPQEEDYVVQRDAHTRDFVYLRETFRSVLRNRPTVHVFADHRIDFNLRDVEPLGPDVAIIDGIEEWDSSQGTLYLAEQGCPLLVAEVTSPDTRHNDLSIKRTFYERAGVPVYVIVDRQAGASRDQVCLRVFRLNNEGYAEVPPDERGRVRLPQFRISLAIEDDHVWVYDRPDHRIEEGPELYAQIEAAEQRLQELEHQFEQEHDLRRREVAARKEAETAKAEADAARLASDAARREIELACQSLQDQLAREHEARLRLEQRLRELERQPPPTGTGNGHP